MAEEQTDRDDRLRDAFDMLKLPGKDTVDLAEVLQEITEKPLMQAQFPLAYQFLQKNCQEELLGGVEYETLKDEVDHYFANDDDDDDDEGEDSKPLEFKDLKKKLSMFSGSREMMDELWETLRLDEYFTEQCREFIISNVLGNSEEA